MELKKRSPEQQAEYWKQQWMDCAIAKKEMEMRVDGAIQDAESLIGYISNLLARRPALDDCKDLGEKVEKTLRRAAEADGLEDSLRASRSRNVMLMSSIKRALALSSEPGNNLRDSGDIPGSGPGTWVKRDALEAILKPMIEN